MGFRRFKRLTILLLWILVFQCMASGSQQEFIIVDKEYNSTELPKQFSTNSLTALPDPNISSTMSINSRNNTRYSRNETGNLSTNALNMTLISTFSNSSGLKFSRLVSGLNIDPHKVSPLTDVNITLDIETQTIPLNMTLVEHYPEGWIIKDANGGLLNIENNTLSWRFGSLNGTTSKSYTILSPRKNLSLPEYEFTAEMLYTGGKDYGIPWKVIVDDSYEPEPVKNLNQTLYPIQNGSSGNITANFINNADISTMETEIKEKDSSVGFSGILNKSYILFEDFESGSFTINKWNISGTGSLWIIEHGENNSYQGSFNALSSGNGIKVLEKEIDTKGYENLNISFFCKVSGLNGSEYLAADWYDGLHWHNIYNETGSTREYVKTTLTLPQDAYNNSFFRLRFTCNMGLEDTVRIDNVEFTGTEIGSDSYGQKASPSLMVNSSTILANEIIPQDPTSPTENFVVGGTSNLNSPVINSISDNPDPIERGESIHITGNVTDDISVSSVHVKIEETNYSMNGNIALGNYTLVIQPGSEGKDAYIGETLLPDFGTASFLHIGHEWRGLLKFDISEIPVNAYINSANLGLYYYEDVIYGPEDLGIFRLTNGWDELAVSWLFRDVLVFWSNPGGDFNPVAEDNLTIDSVFGWYNWSMTQMVRGWHNGTWTNHGVMLKDYVHDERNGKYFYSSDSSSSSLRPKLTVNYTIFSPSDIWQLTFDTSPLPPGVYNYTIYANDSSGNNAVPQAGNFTIINSAPVLSPVGSKNVNESEELTINLSATDPNGDQLTYSTNVTFGNLTGNTFKWTPGLTDAGVYYVEFTVSDGELSDSEIISINVDEAYLNFSVRKKIENGSYPDSYTVTLNLESNVNFDSTGIRVYDFIPANFTLSDPIPSFNGSQDSIYYWNVKLAAGEKKTIVYRLEGTGRYSLREAFRVGVDPQ